MLGRFIIKDGRSLGTRAPERNLVRLIAQAHRCLFLLTMDRLASVNDMAKALLLAFLAPNVVNLYPNRQSTSHAHS
jgi:hypothetical protein